MRKTLLVTMFSIAGLLSATGATSAQVVGGKTVGVAIAEMNEVVIGWSAKKSILGKTVFNDNGDKVGKVDDLIVAPDKNVSYLIVGAGAFVGMGRHDIAIPIKQVQEKDGKIVLPGATKEIVKLLPKFEYAKDTASRDEFVAGAEKDIAKAKVRIAELEKKGTDATNDAKTKLNHQIVALKRDVKSVDATLGEMRKAVATEWKEMEDNVTSALVRLRQTIEKSASSEVRVRRTFLAYRSNLAPCPTMPIIPFATTRSNAPWLEHGSDRKLTSKTL